MKGMNMNQQFLVDEASGVNTEELSFLAFPAKQSSAQVSGATDSAFAAIKILLEQMLARASEATSREDFISAREEVIRQYYRVMLALGGLISVSVPRAAIDRLTFESLTEMEAEFVQYGRQLLGEALCEQALFTVYTLRRINLAGQKLQMLGHFVSDSRLEDDHEASRSFIGHVLFARFHIDCMLTAVRMRRALYPDVMAEISDGLLALVNAYAHVQQSILYRTGNMTEDEVDLQLDDEDRDLLASSTREALL